MLPVQNESYETLATAFNAEFTRATKEFDKYDKISNDIKPRNGCMISCLNVEVEGRQELVSTVILRKMTLLEGQIKALIPTEAVLGELQGKIQEVNRRHTALIESLKDKLINFPESLVYEHDDRKATLKGFPSIGECNCCEPLTRARGSLRRRFTYRVSDAVHRLKPPDSSLQQVTLCSIGSGACFHELEIHACLSEKYKVKWVLIDLLYKPGTYSKGVIPKVFELLAKTISPSTEVESYHDEGEYFKQPVASPDVIMVIDFQEGDKPVDVQLFRERQKEVIAKGHKCVLAILDKYNKAKQVDIQDLGFLAESASIIHDQPERSMSMPTKAPMSHRPESGHSE